MEMVGGSPQGYAFFVYETPQLAPDLYYLGNSLDSILSSAQRQWIKVNLGLPGPITESRLVDILYRDLLVLNADPTGQTRWKPLRGTARNGVALYIAGHKVVNEAIVPGGPVFDNTISVYQADYATQKANLTPLDSLQKQTGDKMLSLWGRAGDDLLPLLLGENAVDGWRYPETTLGDTFVESSDTALSSHTATGPNGGFGWGYTNGTWTVIAATDDVDAATGSARNIAYADSALSSDGHYAEAEVVLANSSGNGVTYRATNSATQTHYFAEIKSTNTVTLFKSITGTLTQLDQQAITYAANKTVKGQATEGDSHSVWYDGVLEITLSDTSITGAVYAGIRGFDVGNTLDSFEGADLSAPTARRIIIITKALEAW
jgi:hypothetical protein